MSNVINGWDLEDVMYDMENFMYTYDKDHILEWVHIYKDTLNAICNYKDVVQDVIDVFGGYMWDDGRLNMSLSAAQSLASSFYHILCEIL